MLRLLKKQSPARIIALGFLSLILLGSVLLYLPSCLRDGVSVRYIDTLYTATSAVCVTGLVVVDVADTFTPLGQAIVAVLMQIGGLGVTSIGAGVILMLRKKINLKSGSLIRETMNLGSGKGILLFIRNIFLTTLVIELVGAILSFFVFVQDYAPGKAAWISIFHSIAAFNNSGFDVLGNFQSMIPYQHNVPLNLITCALIILGGIGFWVIKEVQTKRFRWKKFSMHTKVVLTVTAVLTVVGALLLKLTEEITWLGAVFQSVSTRTAGFSSYPLGRFSNAGLLVVIFLMFIGASPGSTGGGIKTTTFFALLLGIYASATNQSEKAFRYTMPADAFRKAAVITLIGLGIVLGGTYLMTAMDPNLPFIQALFEVTSAFGTVGLSTGITGGLSLGSKLLSILIMYIGRLGPITIATIWYFNPGERVSFPEGNLSIG